MKMRKRVFKIAAAVMCVILLLSAFCATASAASGTPIGSIVALSDNITSQDVLSDPEYLAYRAFLDENDGVVNALYNGVIDMQTNINISGYNVSVNYFGTLTYIMRTSFPELWYVQQYSGGYNPNTGMLTNIKPVYIDGDVASMKQAFFEAAGELYLPLVNENMDDFTKAVILHDALALNTYYPDLSVNSDNGSNYTYMVEGWGVCQYYSECYAYLLAQCGINSEVISSTSMDHAWLKIELDGHYYQVDLTWDDPVYDRAGMASHEYFLFSDTAFPDHYGYRSINSAVSAKYDNFTNLHDFGTKLCYIDGVFYAITSNGRLVSYNHQTDEITVLRTLNYRWPYSGGGNWVGCFSSLDEYGGKLYYNSPYAVYSYDPATGETETVAEREGNMYLYGLRIVGDQLWGVYANDPNGQTPPQYTNIAGLRGVHSVTVDENTTHLTVTADTDSAYEGDLVTLDIIPEDGFAVGTVTVNNTEIFPQNGVYSFNMPDSDAVIRAEYAFADSVGAKLAGYTLSMDGDIGVNFYMELSDDVLTSESAYMRFTIPTGANTVVETLSVADASVREMNDRIYYIFKCGVAAKEMTSEIKAQIIDGDRMGTEYTYSVREYAEYVLAHPEIGDYAEAAGLVKAMLNYGAYSQIFFDKNTADPANINLSPEDRQLADITAADIDRSDFSSNLPEGARLAGATLSLRSQTALSLYFISDHQLQFDCDRDFETSFADGYQVLTVTDISARELGDDFSVTVWADGNQGTVSYSPMNYCYNALSAELIEPDANLQNVVKALYSYWQAAAAYFEEN